MKMGTNFKLIFGGYSFHFCTFFVVVDLWLLGKPIVLPTAYLLDLFFVMVLGLPIFDLRSSIF